MLSAIVAVTLLVPDVGAVERAYQQSLDYQTVERGQVAADQARSWGADALAGRKFVVLQPSSGEPVYLRMIETDAAPAPALKALGWTATEILVEDPVRLEARLKDSPFHVIGPPAPLDFNPAVVAMHGIRSTLDFYATTFGLTVTEPATTRIEILAEA